MKIHLPREVVDLVKNILGKNKVLEKKVLIELAKQFEKYEKNKSKIKIEKEDENSHSISNDKIFNGDNVGKFNHSVTDSNHEKLCSSSDSNVNKHPTSSSLSDPPVILLRTMMDFKIIGSMGTGGFATVYKIRSILTGKLFAVYILFILVCICAA
jgi:hypothetical protein